MAENKVIATKPEGIELSLSYDTSINYAFQQNAIPAIKELRLKNTGGAKKDLQIRITTEPAFAPVSEIRLETLPKDGEFRKEAPELRLSHDFLAGLNERVTGHIKIGILEGEKLLTERTEPISLLARNEWCGLQALPEILAAFVLPNDPAVMGILSRVSDILKEHTSQSSINGYQEKNKKRVWDQLAAIYKAISELQIRYINPPASFEKTGQKIRFPSEIVEQRFGTCLDLTLLFCACCEQAGLHPLVLIHSGHAYAGCWLEERTLATAATDDLQQIRKLAVDALITVFDATLATNDVPRTLRDAEKAAEPYLITDKPFNLALDIKRSRVAQIRPLPIPNKSGVVNEAAETPRPDLGLGSRDFKTLTIEAPAKEEPITRIEQWKNRLLDLTLRNRFLNFKETKSVIRFLGDPLAIMAALEASREFSIQPEPEVMSKRDPRSKETYSSQRNEDAVNEHLQKELEHGRLHTSLSEYENPTRLTDLFRAARSSLEENGANTLFAAVGFLEWRETEKSDAVLKAPILLVPVQLRRKSVLEGFTLQRLDEDIHINVTLIEMLRQHFQKEITGLDPLPEDAENRVNAPLIMQLFRDAVRDLPGWEVKSDVWLGQFSFTKFLLWRDLHTQLDALTKNRVVKHLIHGAGSEYPNPAEDFHPHELDDRFKPSEVFCTRGADSSQLAAIMAAAAGHDFVLEGPPGTGKSQTITNIIAQCLHASKRVLFVAEKRTALEVVHRRLREDGLERFCLELHSNKTGKIDVLNQFAASLDMQLADVVEDRVIQTERLQAVQEQLNTYARSLHQRARCGLSAFNCFDYLLPRANIPSCTLQVTDILQMKPDGFHKAADVAARLQDRSAPLFPLKDHPLKPLTCEEWSPLWAERTLQSVLLLKTAAARLTQAANDLPPPLRPPADQRPRLQLDRLSALAQTLLSFERATKAFITSPWADISQVIEKWRSMGEERIKVRLGLKVYDEAKLTALDHKDLSLKLTEAEADHGLFRWWKTRRVRKAIAATHPGKKMPEAAELRQILSGAELLKALNESFAKSRPEGEALLGRDWANGEPDPERLKTLLLFGARLSETLTACVQKDPTWARTAREWIATVIAETPEALRPQSESGQPTPIGSDLSGYRSALEAFQVQFDATAEALGLNKPEFQASANYPLAAELLAERLPASWSKIREWCAWQKARKEAYRSGLGPLSDLVENTQTPLSNLAEIFQCSFRKTLLNALIEESPALRTFFGDEHDQRIAQFRQLDAEIEANTGKVIRAKLSQPRPLPGHKTSAVIAEFAHRDIPREELGLLRREVAKKTRHLPMRKLLAGIPNLMPRLKPCVLMSPLSVAQYLSADKPIFDVVIFDEASQIPVWDAVGAIARGTQLIVVGDPKQLPPTNFFAAKSDDEDSIPEETKDLESILDELLSTGMRHKRLQWHYRSQQEGLIAFSNNQYYNNELLTFPSTNHASQGINFVHVPNARYDMGKSRTNRVEAQALVDFLVERLKKKGPKRSFGIVTFSLPQQQLVENLLDEKIRRHPEIEVHFGDNPPVEGEPVIVKNLESIQGDERDVILFSICYGPDAAGKVSMNFGALNKDGGERRLNVAVTRAKHELWVFSGLKSDQIDLTRTQARGVRDLKYFLDYAERGPKALTAATSATSTGEAESEFERLVAQRIEAAGYTVHAQVGCSGYRIDMAIVDPAAPGRYLLGVECDGATYHRAATARDRDKLRQHILEGLGWKLHRIWSTDWWHNPEAEMQKLLARINKETRR